MKKLFLVLAIAAVSAVSASAQTSIGVGYVDGALTGFSKLETSGELSDVTLSTTGFYVEGMMNVPISDGFSFVPGVRYIYGTNSGNKNFTFSEDFVLGGSGTVKEHSIAVPLNLQFTANVGENSKFFIFAGPTFSYGLSYKANLSAKVGNVSVGGDVNLYGNLVKMNRTDVFVGGGVGAQFGLIQVKVAYDYGVLDRFDYEKFGAHSKQLRVGVAYLF